MRDFIRPLMAVLAMGAQLASAQTPDVAIVGAHIEVGDGTTLPDGTVILIHGGKIASVGANLPIPTGATVVDAAGMYVYPGFIDAYQSSGLKLPEAPPSGSAPDARTSAPPSMWHGNRKGIRGDILAYKSLNLKDRIKDAYGQGITTALLAPGTGGMVRGIASVVDYSDTPTVLLEDAAADLAFRGGSGGGYPGTLFGNIALLRQTLYDSSYYALQPPKKPDAVYANLQPLVSGKIPGLFAADTSRDISRSARIANEFGFKAIIVGGKEAYRNLDFVKEHSIGVIVSPDLGTEPSLKPETGADAVPTQVLQERHDYWLERSKNIEKMNEAGVPFAFSAMGMFNLDEYLKDVRSVIAAGLPREAALKALTSAPATILGVSDKVGTIAPGKLANFVLMSGDFANNASEVRSVIVEGKKIDLKKGASK